jgi:hypothetical protein
MKQTNAWLVSFATMLVVGACSAENEEVSDTSSALRSPVDCKPVTDTAYVKGKSQSITLVRVGSKRVTVPVAHAFLAMQAAAHSAGVKLTLNSGFRTMDEQKYFYDCFLTKKCNRGRLAAKPGFSNHQSGTAVDLSTSPWLAANAKRFGFVRTVAKEPWHYEYIGAGDPGGACAAVETADRTLATAEPTPETDAGTVVTEADEDENELDPEAP